MSGRLEKRITVYCPTHDGYWVVERAATQMLCPMGSGHLLPGVPGGDDLWEYCSDCDTFWAANLPGPQYLKQSCRRCMSKVASRFLCRTCATLVIEPEAASDNRRVRFEAGHGLVPYCPGCHRVSEGRLFLHECEQLAASFITSRAICPFCHESTEAENGLARSVATDECRGCGQDLPAGSKFCGYCGHTLDSGLETPEEAPDAVLYRNALETACTVRSDAVPPVAAPRVAAPPVAAPPVAAPPIAVPPIAVPPVVVYPVAAPPPRLVGCPACGNDTPADSRFCEHCAWPLQDESADGSLEREKPSSRNSSSPFVSERMPTLPSTAFHTGILDADHEKPGPASVLAVQKPVLIVAGAVVLGLLLIAGVWSSTNTSFLTRIDKAIAENRIVSPATDCVSDIFDAEVKRSGESPDVAEARRRIRAVLEPKINDLLLRRYKKTPDEDPITWSEHEPQFALLARLYPADSNLNGAYMFCRGMRKSDARENDQSLADLARAVELRRNWALALNAIGNLYGRKKDWSGADEVRLVEYYKRACQADPNYTWPFKNLGNHYMGKGQLAEAEYYFLEARRCYPSYPKTLTDLADICELRGDFDCAIAYLEEAKKAMNDRGRTEDVRKVEESIENLRARAR